MDSRKTFQGTIHSQRIFNSESNSFIYKLNTEDKITDNSQDFFYDSNFT